MQEEFASETEQAISRVQSYLGTIPGMEVSFSREETALQSSLGTTESPFALEISGKDFAEMEEYYGNLKHC